MESELTWSVENNYDFLENGALTLHSPKLLLCSVTSALAWANSSWAFRLKDDLKCFPVAYVWRLTPSLMQLNRPCRLCYHHKCWGHCPHSWQNPRYPLFCVSISVFSPSVQFFLLFFFWPRLKLSYTYIYVFCYLLYGILRKQKLQYYFCCFSVNKEPSVWELRFWCLLVLHMGKDTRVQEERFACALFSVYWDWCSFCFHLAFTVFCLLLKCWIDSWGLPLPLFVTLPKVLGGTVSIAYLRKPSWGTGGTTGNRSVLRLKKKK